MANVWNPELFGKYWTWTNSNQFKTLLKGALLFQPEENTQVFKDARAKLIDGIRINLVKNVDKAEPLANVILPLGQARKQLKREANIVLMDASAASQRALLAKKQEFAKAVFDDAQRIFQENFSTAAGKGPGPNQIVFWKTFLDVLREEYGLPRQFVFQPRAVVQRGLLQNLGLPVPALPQPQSPPQQPQSPAPAPSPQKTKVVGDAVKEVQQTLQNVPDTLTMSSLFALVSSVVNIVKTFLEAINRIVNVNRLVVRTVVGYVAKTLILDVDWWSVVQNFFQTALELFRNGLVFAGFVVILIQFFGILYDVVVQRVAENPDAERLDITNDINQALVVATRNVVSSSVVLPIPSPSSSPNPARNFQRAAKVGEPTEVGKVPLQTATNFLNSFQEVNVQMSNDVVEGIEKIPNVTNVRVGTVPASVAAQFNSTFVPT